MDAMESHDVASPAVPTPGRWTAQMVRWWTWDISTEDERHVAIVHNEIDDEREHVQANAQLIAAAPQMLAALKEVDAHLIGLALKTAQGRGFDVSWEKAEVMFGVSDVHAAIRQAIATAEGGR